VTELDYAGDIGETTPISWQPKNPLSFDEWIAIGNTLQQVGASLNWWVGDWLNYGEQRWGEMYAQAEVTTGWDYQRLANAKWVASRVHFSLRQENLKFSHHAEVASLSPEEQAAWLNRAEYESWSVRRLREEIKGPQLPKLTPIFADPDDAPFNHRPRTDISSEARTPVDEYEEQAEALSKDEEGYDWTENEPAPTVSAEYDSDEWFTPIEFIEAARAVMGSIDLDPASSHAAQKVVGATTYYTIEDDGLEQGWIAESLWLNPPYSAPRPWVEKLVASLESGSVESAILLVNTANSPLWTRPLWHGPYTVCLLERRVRFWRPDRPDAKGFDRDQMIWYLGCDVDRFRAVFEVYGAIR
jgi:phage N-6-adenine-methyltransferase